MIIIFDNHILFDCHEIQMIAIVKAWICECNSIVELTRILHTKKQFYYRSKILCVFDITIRDFLKSITSTWHSNLNSWHDLSFKHSRTSVNLLFSSLFIASSHFFCIVHFMSSFSFKTFRWSITCIWKTKSYETIHTYALSFLQLISLNDMRWTFSYFCSRLWSLNSQLSFVLIF